MINNRRHVLGFAALLMLMAGCAASNSVPIEQQLAAYEPATRIHAIGEISRQKRTDLMPRLVERLDDEDSAVRYCAILTLEKFTGTRLAYDYAAQPFRRRASIEEWRRYVQNQQQAPTTGGSPATASSGQ